MSAKKDKSGKRRTGAPQILVTGNIWQLSLFQFQYKLPCVFSRQFAPILERAWLLDTVLGIHVCLVYIPVYTCKLMIELAL